MTENQKSQCEVIIHSAAVAAGAAGAVPIPCSDCAVIGGIQLTMVVALAKVFDHSITDKAAEQIAKQGTLSIIGKLAATSLTKLIPGFGSAVCASVAFGLTEAYGWEVAEKFAKEYKALPAY